MFLPRYAYVDSILVLIRVDVLTQRRYRFVKIEFVFLQLF